MSYFNCISKLLGLQGILPDSENYSETDDAIIVPDTTEKSTQTCPRCGSHTSKVHDYRYQLIKDIPFRRKVLYLKLKNRRYVCPHCGKRFFEHKLFKVLKRNAFGFRNFENFRKRILLLT